MKYMHLVFSGKEKPHNSENLIANVKLTQNLELTINNTSAILNNEFSNAQCR